MHAILPSQVKWRQPPTPLTSYYTYTYSCCTQSSDTTEADVCKLDGDKAEAQTSKSMFTEKYTLKLVLILNANAALLLYRVWHHEEMFCMMYSYHMYIIQQRRAD